MSILSRTVWFPWSRPSTTGLLLLALLVGDSLVIRADTLSSNLASASAGTEAATADTWLVASFITDSSNASLGTVSLALADLTASGAIPQVGLYTDDGLNEPGTEVGALTTNSVESSTLSDVTFTGGNLTLAADSKYWIVLSATFGEVDWSYASDDHGTGVGFTDTCSQSYDAGNTWYTFASNQNAGVFPLQMDVESGASDASATPEPTTVSSFW